MGERERAGVWAPKAFVPTEDQKQRVVLACDALIENILKPKFLPVIRETEWNYPVAMHGDYRAGRYRFIIRFQSGWPDNPGEEFDAPFARLDMIGPDEFNIQWKRHTGQWWLLHRRKTLQEALHLIETDGVLRPPV